jgi:hypothetical protein
LKSLEKERKIQGREYVYSYYPIYSYPYKDYVENDKINYKNVFILGEEMGYSYFTLLDY